MKKAVFAAVALAAGFAGAAEPAAEVEITVDAAREIGPIRLMNAVNNGPAVAPVGGDQKCGNFQDYKNLRIPYARTHDSINCVSGGAHCCDINAIFPDFDADETKAENYDFVFTDHYLDSMRRAGTEVFFRLGQTIEHGPKKYGVLPPKDYAKWARICEHVIRHYNEGWGWGVDKELTTRNVAWSNQFNIVYWEIWNEPDLDGNYLELPRNPRTWGGTVTNFFNFYETAAKHLKKTFPALKIGGPALCGWETWAHDFLVYCRDTQTPLDFFSWHIYARTPEPIVAKCGRIRAMLDACGFSKTESILNEWNYVKGWVDDWVYSLECESGVYNLKGAAFIAAVQAACQDAPLDMLMFYDARARCGMNNLFDQLTLAPLKGYYPFYAWTKLLDRGTEVGTDVVDRKGRSSDANTGNVERKDTAAAGGFRAVSAKGQDGRLAVFVVRYSDDDNSSETGRVVLRVKGRAITSGHAHVTDRIRSYTEVPLLPQDDGSAVLFMQPLSFALIEL